MVRQPLRIQESREAQHKASGQVATSANLTQQGLMARGGYYIDSKILGLGEGAERLSVSRSSEEAVEEGHRFRQE